MHLASEVTSTTNHTSSSSSEKTINSTNNGTTNTSNSGGNNNTNSANAPLTAENLAERTIDSLLAEHPGELVKTGCPHVVSNIFFYLNSKSRFKGIKVKCIEINPFCILCDTPKQQPNQVMVHNVD